MNPTLSVCIDPLEWIVPVSLPALRGASMSTELSMLLEAKDIHGRMTDELLREESLFKKVFLLAI